MPVSRGEVAVWSLFSFAAAYTGPFGTYSLGFGWRLTYWALVVVISALMANAFSRLAWKWIGPGRRLQRDLLLAALMTVFFTPVLIAISRHFLSGDFASYADIFYFGQYVAIITIGVASGRRLFPRGALGRFSGAKAAWTTIPEQAPAPASPRLMRRLPDGFCGPILRLTVEDHFVDVIGPEQIHRLRMRLADAIDEMDPVEGFLTHRSHWVARDAVSTADRDGARLYLRLTNGDRVPVSRTYREGLEKAGLI